MAEPFDIVGEEYVVAVLDSFGGLRPMAKEIGLGVSTVQGWKQRSRIPGNRLELINASAIRKDIILPEFFRKALDGNPEMDPANIITEQDSSDETLSAADLAMAQEFGDNDINDISAVDNNDITSKKPTLEEETVEGGGAFRDRSKARIEQPRTEPTLEPTMEEAAISTPNDGGHGGGHGGAHGAVASDLPKSTAAHWALLLSFMAILAVVTRPLWSDGIDRKLQASLGGHGDEHGEGHGDEATDDHGGGGGNLQVGAVLDRITEMEERLEQVEQANASLALLSFNFQQEQGVEVFGQQRGMSAEELKKLEDARLGVEILKKEAVTNQVQIDSLTGLLKQLEENSRLLSRRLENVELESGQLFERNFSRSIGLFYALELLDSRIRDGLNFQIQLSRFDDLTKNTDYRDDISNHINILRLHQNQPIIALPILSQQYSDFLYPVLVNKTDSEADNWQEQALVRVRSLVHFKKQEQISELNDLLRAEYYLSQGNLEEGIRYAKPDIIRYGQDTKLSEWLKHAEARQEVLAAVDAIRSEIGDKITESLKDLSDDLNNNVSDEPASAAQTDEQG
ncbi:MAG: hypothetical protein K0U39_08365 [Alphaproteobacteria bacterium]|nr:hypothetical protein [Alphaproteobacteria bacterium]